MTREEWLRHAVEEIDTTIFNGDLDLLNHNFQIACGRCPGSKPTECIQPYEGEDVKLEDFFPTTIHVNFTIKNPIDILVTLSFECIHAFFNIKGCNKKFKKLAEQYYFEAPYKEAHASSYLMDLINQIYAKLKKNYGDFPGTPVVFPKKDPKESKKNSVVVFCPECGYTFKISNKVYGMYEGKFPICPCGTRMTQDLEDSDEEI